MSRSIVQDVGATLKNATIGGEIVPYTELLHRATDRALERMKESALKLGADGIYAVRIATPQVTQGAAEVVVYGTAYRR
jgi:uncharacterized protein YbjQ (UPF0145 family)